MNSSMIVTEPLPESVWEEIGWCGAELVGDMGHTFAYSQRTADGVSAIGRRRERLPDTRNPGTDWEGATAC
jgi:hypothetical protein